jgi:hypothetical protein
MYIGGVTFLTEGTEAANKETCKEGHGGGAQAQAQAQAQAPPLHRYYISP